MLLVPLLFLFFVLFLHRNVEVAIVNLLHFKESVDRRRSDRRVRVMVISQKPHLSRPLELRSVGEGHVCWLRVVEALGIVEGARAAVPSDGGPVMRKAGHVLTPLASVVLLQKLLVILVQTGVETLVNIAPFPVLFCFDRAALGPPFQAWRRLRLLDNLDVVGIQGHSWRGLAVLQVRVLEEEELT